MSPVNHFLTVIVRAKAVLEELLRNCCQSSARNASSGTRPARHKKPRNADFILAFLIARKAGRRMSMPCAWVPSIVCPPSEIFIRAGLGNPISLRMSPHLRLSAIRCQAQLQRHRPLFCPFRIGRGTAGLFMVSDRSGITVADCRCPANPSTQRARCCRCTRSRLMRRLARIHAAEANITVKNALCGQRCRWQSVSQAAGAFPPRPLCPCQPKFSCGPFHQPFGDYPSNRCGNDVINTLTGVSNLGVVQRGCDFQQPHCNLLLRDRRCAHDLLRSYASAPDNGYRGRCSVSKIQLVQAKARHCDLRPQTGPFDVTGTSSSFVFENANADPGRVRNAIRTAGLRQR